MKMPTVNEDVNVNRSDSVNSSVKYRAHSTLQNASVGQRVQVQQIISTPVFEARLQSMGFVPGVPINVVSKHRKSMIVEVLRSRLSLSAEAASAITVRVS
ncbi:MAG: ferrous iron transport protein A [Verrucomicrobia bacterium]|nr:ferrous iron transport protein A [Verrucomicrobiota bacterium]